MATSAEILFIMRLRDEATAALNVLSQGFAAVSEVVDATVGKFTSYELGMANIQKTTGQTTEEMTQFAASFDILASKMPISIKQLQDIGYAAGSLGVQGKDNVLAITEAVAMLGTTTNLKGEDAVKSMARLLNIFGESVQGAKAMGSEIVALDNTTAATAKEILNMGTQVGLATAQFHLGSAASLAIGASLAELGVRAELGGTTVGRVFQAIDQSLQGDLPKGLKILTQLFGESGDAMKKAFAADPEQFFVDFIGHLNAAKLGGSDLIRVEADLGLAQQNVNKSLNPLIANYQSLKDKVVLVAAEQQVQTAQMREFNIFAQTQDSMLKVLQNNWDLLGKNMGQAVSGQVKGAISTLNTFLKEMNDIFTSLSPNTQKFLEDAAILVTTFTALGSAVAIALGSIRLLSAALVTTPIGLAALAIAALGTGVLALTGYFNDLAPLTQSEADKLNLISTSADAAAIAMEGLNKQEAYHLKAALEQQLADAQKKLDALTSSIKTTNINVGAYVDMMDQAAIQSEAALEKINKDWTDGKITVQEYHDKLLEMSRSGDDELAKQAAKILALIPDWTAAAAAIDKYKDRIAQLGDPEKRPDQSLPQYGPPRPPHQAPDVTPQVVTPSPQKATGGNNDQQVADFIKSANEKIAALKSETDAYNLSKEASVAANLAAKEAAEVDAFEKRGIDLKIPSIKQMTDAYAQALRARDQAKINQDVDQEVKKVDKMIQAFADEDEALAKGAAAYDEYKKKAQLTKDSDAIYARIIALGGEADAAHKVADSYQAMADANAKAMAQYDQQKKQEADMQSFSKDLTTQLTNSANAFLFQGKSATSAADSFAKAIAEMVLKEALLKPLQNNLENFFSELTGGGTGGSSGGGFGGNFLMSPLLSMLGFGGGSSGIGVNANEYTDAIGPTIDGGELASSLSSVGGSMGTGSTGLGSLFSWFGSFFHQGGLVGGAVNGRMLPAATWNDAPRYHTGLASDEFAAILQRGERVMTAQQSDSVTAILQAVGGGNNKNAGGGAPITFNVQTQNADSFMQSKQQITAKYTAAMAVTKRRNG